MEKTGFGNCEEKNCDTFSGRKVEGEREDGDKMQCLCAHLRRSQQIHFTGVSPDFYHSHREASLPGIVTRMSCVPEHFYSLKEQIIGAVIEECRDECVLLSTKAAAPPQVLPQNKVKLLGYCQCFRCSSAAVHTWQGSSVVSSNFAPFELTANVSNMKLH